jgi:hypothetical protein
LASDPGTHTARVVDPSGHVTTYLYPTSSAIVADGSGTYTLTYPQSLIGTYDITITDDVNGQQPIVVTTSLALTQIETAQLDFALDLPGFIGG